MKIGKQYMNKVRCLTKQQKSSKNKKEKPPEIQELKNTIPQLKNSVVFPKQTQPCIRKYQEPGGKYIRNYLVRGAKIF